MTEQSKVLLFDNTAPCVTTVCSFIRDNSVRIAEGSASSCNTLCTVMLPSILSFVSNDVKTDRRRGGDGDPESDRGRNKVEEKAEQIEKSTTTKHRKKGK